MLYTVTNTFEAGRPVEVFVDGAGIRYVSHMVEVDTNTGRMVRFVPGPAGGNVDIGGEFLRETLFVPLPISVVFKPRDEADPCVHIG